MGNYVKQGYPKLVVDLKKLRNNITQVMDRCSEYDIKVAGVIKGFTGLLPAALEFEKAGCEIIASSRIEQLQPLKACGCKAETMLIRIPMLSEVEDAVKYCDISLNSEIKVLEALNKAAGHQNTVHKVILMADVGDLREGFWDKNEFVEVVLMVESSMDSLELAGVGLNVGCYGSVQPTPEKLQELVTLATTIEKRIGRSLEYISGGATSSFMRVMDDNIPKGINMLRIGEGIILAYDLPALYNYKTDYLFSDVFTLQAEIIESKVKPSYPVGELGYDSFGHIGQYEDKGMRKRALIALGKVDFGNPFDLIPRDKGIEILGASSDHTIIDVENGNGSYEVGDILEFDVKYSVLVYATSSDNIQKVYVE